MAKGKNIKIAYIISLMYIRKEGIFKKVNKKCIKHKESGTRKETKDER